MAKVEWSAGIDSVSGALSKPGSNPQHSCQKMLLGTHRVAATENPNCNRLFLRKKVKRSTPLTATENPNCNRLFLRKKVKRSTPLTATELWVRNRFRAVKAAVAARKEDLSKISADQAAFLAQKDTAGGKKTMNAYLWKVEGQAYDQDHPRA